MADWLPGAAEVDQPSVGSLSALVARLLTIAVTGPGRIPGPALEEAVAGAAYALTLAADRPWHLVTGTPDPGGGSGMLTEVRRIEAGDLDDARERVLAEITHEGGMRDLGEGLRRGLRDIERRRPS